MPPTSLLEAKIDTLKSAFYTHSTDPVIFFRTYVERYKGNQDMELCEKIRLARVRICLGETREKQYTYLAEFIANRELIEREETKRAH